MNSTASQYWQSRRERDARIKETRRILAEQDWNARVARNAVVTVLPGQSQLRAGIERVFPVSIVLPNGAVTLCNYLR